MPGPGTLVRAGSQTYLFAMDGLGMSVAQSDGHLWTGLAQWFSNGVHNFPYVATDGTPLRQYDLSAKYITSRNQFGVIYTLGMDYSSDPVTLELPVFTPTTFFDWYTPLASYPTFIPSGCAGDQPGVMVIPIAIDSIQAKPKMHQFVQVIG